MIDADKLEAGPELDALIAEKVMGWDVHHREPGFVLGEVWRDPAHSTLYRAGQWCPSSDWSAAFEVVNSIKSMTDLRKRVFENFLIDATGGVPSAYEGVSIFDLTPVMICRAALKAVAAGGRDIE